MFMEEITKKPTYEIITELTRLEQEIDLKIMKYNILAKEICSRFPILKQEETFTPKVLSKGEYKV